MTAGTDTMSSAETGAVPRGDLPLRLRGGWLALGRSVYAGLLLIGIALFALSLAIQFDAGLAPCADPVHANWPFCEAFRQAQTQLGLTQALYESYFMSLRILAALPLWGLSVLLVWRRGEELRVLLLATLMVVLAVAGPIFNPLWE